MLSRSGIARRSSDWLRNIVCTTGLAHCLVKVANLNSLASDAVRCSPRNQSAY
ncbi:hypothetical protein RESH_02338 [Rhodopirellula europaea SH398]|uniref:Uncharacterized protein n=1 Tax=Rhodopirellula europaea SH398 TaxID=1263868 RepID=M5SLC8_9BACT|nr:hypothetical protein RESH_02338 [Rhodopirellula europaea SH398]